MLGLWVIVYLALCLGYDILSNRITTYSKNKKQRAVWLPVEMISFLATAVTVYVAWGVWKIFHWNS